MKKWKTCEQKNICVIIGILYGMFFFNLFYGLKIINPSYTDWIFVKGGDIATHQLGWEFYRNSEWLWPIGCYYGYPYPLKNSIIYTDSVPLLAVMFKCLRDIIPNEFQYWGLWGIVSFCLQGIISSCLLNKLKIDLKYIILAEPFFFANVLIAFRMFMHSALAGQWIILIAISELVCENNGFMKKVAKWTGILVMSLLIQPYFLFMNGVLMVGDALRWQIENKGKIKEVLFILFIPCFFVLLTIYMLGGFELGDFSDVGLGDLTVNLNGLFNPMGHSIFLGDLPYFEYQYEGICYLGLGGIILLLFSCMALFFEKSFNPINVPYLFVGVVLLTLSLGPKITVGDKIAFDYSPFLPELVFRFWSVIRSSGRMIWPVWYMLIIGIIVVISRTGWNKMLVCAILLVSSILQYFDVVPNTVCDIGQYEHSYNCEIKEAMDKISSCRDIETLVYLSEGLPAQKYMDVAYYASRHNMSITTGFFARASIISETTEYKDEYVERLRNNDINNNEVFILNKDYVEQYLLSNEVVDEPKIYIDETDNYLLLYSAMN